MKKFLLILFTTLCSQYIFANSVDTLGTTIEIDTSVTICEGEEFWGYTITGIYVDTLIQNAICTLRTLDLTAQLSPPDVITNVTICEGDFIIIDGVQIDEPGTYTTELNDMGPCPYSYILNVTILARAPDIVTTNEICEGDCYEWFQTEYCLSGTYTVSILDANGCESFQILELNIIPASECASLEVVVFEDTNGDCMYDSSESGLENIRVNIDDKIFKTTDEEGKIISLPRTGIHTVTAELNSNIYTSCNNPQTTLLDVGETTIYIPVEIIEECADVTLDGAIPFLRRCFKNKYVLETLNEGSVTAEDVMLTIEMDSFFEEIETDLELLSVTGNVYTFDIGDLPPRTKERNTISFTLSCDATLGQAHYLSAELNYANACTTLSDTSIVFECRENIGSYDPNDKSIYIDGLADRKVINENSDIEYLIRFQNTGTDTAFTVRIEDELSTDFDLSSITPVSASHDYEWSIERDRNLIVTFNNILLVDSTKNEKESHGFIKFNVALTDERPAPGAIVNNTAEIYFDFNDPIVTNTVESYYLCQHTTSIVTVTICEGEEYEGYAVSGEYADMFVTELGCDSLRTLELNVLPWSDVNCTTSTTDLEEHSLQLYPIPTQDVLHITFESTQRLESYRCYDLSGALVKKARLRGNGKHSISTDELAEGMYLLRLQLENGKHLERRIVVLK